MTLDIALELDHDGVRILRRSGPNATELGTLRLDDPAFDARLAALRSGVCGQRTDVQVLVPQSLVLFLDVGDAAQNEVETRVGKETPCPIDDLVIGREGSVAAVVERATLEEARDFAEAHGFHAAAFAADPGNGSTGVISFRLERRAPTFRSRRFDSDPATEPAEQPDGPEARHLTEALEEAARAEPDELKTPAAAAAAPVATPRWAEGPRWLELSASDDLPEAETAEEEAPLLAAAFRHVEPDAPPETEPTVTTDPPESGRAADQSAAASRSGGWRRQLGPVVEPIPATQPRAFADSDGKVPALPVPKLRPAANEADALTVFGARGEPAARPRGLGLLHLATAALAVGILIAAYQLLTGDSGDIDIVNLEDVATATLDPLTDAAGGMPEAAAPDEGETDVAALDPSVSVVPVPRPVDAPVASESSASEAPHSDLTTPVALPGPDALDTVAPLAAPSLPPTADRAEPGAFTPPPPPGAVFDMDARGLVRPTEDGALTPKGVLVHSGPPALLPPAAAVGRAEVPPVAEKPVDGQHDAVLDLPVDEPPDAALEPADGPTEAAIDIPRTRPELRPDAAADETPAVVALAAQDNTPRPTLRPTTATAAEADEPAAASEPDFDALARQARSQTAAAATGIAATAPRAAEPPPPEPEGRANVPVQPGIPTTAAVAERATVQNALSLNRVNLIGVYGTPSDRRALIRLPSGRYVKVKVGDSVDGGKVASIQDSRVEYVRNGQRYALTLPSG